MQGTSPKKSASAFSHFGVTIKLQAEFLRIKLHVFQKIQAMGAIEWSTIYHTKKAILEDDWSIFVAVVPICSENRFFRKSNRA